MAAVSNDKQVSGVLFERSPHKRSRKDDVSCLKAGAANDGCEIPPPPSRVGVSPLSESSKALLTLPSLPAVPEPPHLIKTNSRPHSADGGVGLDKASGISPTMRSSQRGPRAPSPTPSSTSTFSAATTSATFCTRSSLSSSRSSASQHRRSRRGSDGRFPSTRSFSRPCSAAKSDRFLLPASRDARGRRWRRYGSDRGGGRDIERRREYSRRWSGKDYASEAGSPRARVCAGSRSRSGSRLSTRGKRSRSGSRDNRSLGKASGESIKCSRCLQWCRAIHERKITRTLPMEYWVRTPACKEAKSKHLEYMDKMTYSREQFIEETVFTCPFTGVQRDIVLERNMFPYDVPTDVEHWTLWSRKDLDQSEMKDFVDKWVAENHPHAVEWEYDNNEGDRSIDWFHVHVFFRLNCEDKSGVPRDPSSAYQGPCRTTSETTSGEDSSDEEIVSGVAVMDFN